MNNEKLLIIIILILLILLGVSCINIYNYKSKTAKMSVEISRLNTTVSNLKKKNDNSENLDDIEIKVQKCMKSCGYTSACMSNCVIASENDWQKKLDISLAKLAKFMTREQYLLLLQTQEDWKVYANHQRTLNSIVIGNFSGSIYSNLLSGAQVGLIEQRAKILDWFVFLYSSQK